MTVKAVLYSVKLPCPQMRNGPASSVHVMAVPGVAFTPEIKEEREKRAGNVVPAFCFALQLPCWIQVQTRGPGQAWRRWPGALPLSWGRTTFR